MSGKIVRQDYLLNRGRVVTEVQIQSFSFDQLAW